MTIMMSLCLILSSTSGLMVKRALLTGKVLASQGTLSNSKALHIKRHENNTAVKILLHTMNFV